MCPLIAGELLWNYAKSVAHLQHFTHTALYVIIMYGSK